MTAAPVGNMIEGLGGGICNCFSDCEVCLCGAFCPICQIGQSFEGAGMGGCCQYCLCAWCMYPVGFCYLGTQLQELNKKLGGTQDSCLTYSLCFLCCPHCQSCQLARAVKKAKETGLLKGSPEGVEMSR